MNRRGWAEAALSVWMSIVLVCYVLDVIIPKITGKI